MSDAAKASATADEVARDDGHAPPRNEKRKGRDEDEDERHGDETGEPAVKGRKLTHSEEMQLRLIASLPSMQAPMRDARGRRKSVCVGSTEIVEAGLSALVGGSAAIASSSNEDGALDQTCTTSSASSLAQNIENDQQDEQGDLQHASGKSLCKADESSPRDVE